MREPPLAIQPGLRTALREHTSAIHQELDDLVGHFETTGQYQAFVLQSYRFRVVVEPACAGAEAWAPQRLVEDLRVDLQDLGVPVPGTPALNLVLASTSEKLGGLYVLEGSALGARLLRRRAETLGFTALSGGRHLARQTDDAGRWKQFLIMLDDQDIDVPTALAAARHVFEAALAIYAEAVHDHA